MIWFGYILIFLFLLLVQTTVIPSLFFIAKVYDLLIPFIIYIYIFGETRDALISLLVIGFIVDNLSGAPFGTFSITYIFLFLCMQCTASFLNIESNLLISLITAFTVFLENFLQLFFILVASDPMIFPLNVFNAFLSQIFQAICTAPLIVFGIRFVHRRIDAAILKLFQKPNDDDILW